MLVSKILLLLIAVAHMALLFLPVAVRADGMSEAEWRSLERGEIKSGEIKSGEIKSGDTGSEHLTNREEPRSRAADSLTDLPTASKEISLEDENSRLHDLEQEMLRRLATIEEPKALEVFEVDDL